MSGGNIILHPEKGVNPRIGVCVRCGKEHSVVLLGKWDRTFHCSECQMVTIGAQYRKCDNCKSTRGEFKPIGEFDRLPCGYCHDCEKELKEHASIVALGGIYWRCTDCQQSGVIRASPFTEEVRRHHHLTNGEPCGVEFTKQDCPACGVKP